MRERIGPYRVERVLGTGAFATVWLARDEGLDAHVAIKVLAENWALDEEVRRRFTEEARILWRAASDHIVRVHTIGELEDGRPYFAMDYADRGSLAERMAARASEGRPFSVGRGRPHLRRHRRRADGRTRAGHRAPRPEARRTSSTRAWASTTVTASTSARCSPTSASPGRWPAPEAPRSPPAPRTTWRPSRRTAEPTSAATSTALRSSSTSCSPVGCRTPTSPPAG